MSCHRRIAVELYFLIEITLYASALDRIPSVCFSQIPRSTMAPEDVARSLPSLSTPLAAKDWHNQTASEEFFYKTLPSNWKIHSCTSPEFPAGFQWRCLRSGPIRYKVINRVLYRDTLRWNSTDTSLQPHSGDSVGEDMLHLANYFYELPDMDFLISTHDAPLEVEEFPVHQYSVWANRNKTGYAIPHKADWLFYAWDNTTAYDDFFECMWREHPWKSKQAKVYWRGSSTTFFGSSDFMTAEERAAVNASENPWMGTVFNHRMYAAFVLRPFLWADARITEIITDTKTLSLELIKGDWRPMDSWNNYSLQYHINGVGYTSRPMHQLMSTTPLMHINSSLREWYQPFLKHKVHVEFFNPDMSDFVSTAKALIDEFKNTDGARLQKMVHAANTFAKERFNFWAALDALVWGLLDANQYKPWKVRLTPEFEPAPCRGGEWNPYLGKVHGKILELCKQRLKQQLAGGLP